MSFILVSAEAVVIQETLWEETLADDASTEKEARHGGAVRCDIDPIMMHDIQVIVSRLVAKAKQLIGNFTTNLVEGWMEVRSKFDGGKVTNRSQSGSWEHRCYGAGLQHNLGRSWGPATWEKLTNSPPNQVFVSAAEATTKKVDKTRKRKATEEAKNSRRQSKYSRVDNTLSAQKAYNRQAGVEPDDTTDVPLEYLNELKTTFYTTQVEVTKEQAEVTEEQTRGQSDCELWARERRKRVTASKVGGIAKMRRTTKRSNKVQEMLYSTFRGNQATQYGTAMEAKTSQQYTVHQKENGHANLQTHKSGLVISVTNPWLAASPDERVHDPSTASSPWGIAEYKNPHSAKNLTLEEACDKVKVKQFCLEKIEKNSEMSFRLKKRHNYYFQVQCQMYCCDVDWCDFVLRTDKELHVERIQRDQDWWDQQLPKLKTFYFDALLPELACPRFGKGGIREPV